MDKLPTDGLLAPGLVLLCMALATSWPLSWDDNATNHKVISRAEIQLSPMGRVAQKFVTDPVISSGHMEGPPINKGETTIAADGQRNHIVVGFNDPRGFSQSPISTCGFMVSDDGGQTFLDCGRLPAPEGAALFGHPQVRYMGGSNFIYTCLVVKHISDDQTAQTICLFRSNDYGHNWEGPFELSSATPSDDAPATAADKEFVDVDPDTGRVLVTWTEFGSSGTEESPTQICAAYSDDVLTARVPTWSAKIVLNDGRKTYDSGAMPKFGRGGTAYVVWSESLPDSKMRNIAISHSNDDGASWSAPIELRSSFFIGMDEVVGGDTANDFPCVAVDTSLGVLSGSVYVAYADNSNHDGADVVLQRSADGGKSFSEPVSLSPTPGHDGPQWFPSMSVDTITGKINVFYFDQSVSRSGDLTNAVEVGSEDGGANWSAPTALTEKPFHAAAGANAGEPNLGEYNEILSAGGEALTMVPLRPAIQEFSESAVRSRSALVDFEFKQTKGSAVPLRLDTARTYGSTGHANLEPGDSASLQLTLRHFATNLRMGPRVISHIHARISTDTPGITLTSYHADFSDVVAGATTWNMEPFRFEIAPDFDVRVPIEFVVELESAEGNATIPVTLHVGDVQKQKIFEETFARNANGDLPTGWTDSSQAGAVASKWKVETGATTCLYHPSLAGDLSKAEGSIFESVMSPAIKVSPRAEAISIDFDIAYNTDSDNTLAKLAYSGCALRIVEQTEDEAESRLANSIATEFTMEAKGEERYGYPCHLPESSNPSYLQNVDAWGGLSRGVEHVHFEIPDVAGKKVRLRWDYTEDPQMKGHIDLKSGLPPGVMISNLVVSSETRTASPGIRTLAKAATFTLNEGSYVRTSLQKLIHVSESTCATTIFSVDKAPLHGHLYLHSDGLFMYQPNNGFNGEDHFSYTVTDMGGQNSTAFVYLAVNPILRAVVLPSQIKPDSTTSGLIVLTGSAPPDGLSINLESAAPKFISVPQVVKVAPLAKSAYFAIHSGSSVSAVHTYVFANLNGAAKSVEAVLLPQHYPAAADHNFLAFQGDRLTVGSGTLFSGAKTLVPHPLTAARVTPPSHGVAQVNLDGSFSYVPTSGYCGSDSFKYKIIQNGKESESASIDVQVMPTVRQVLLAKDTIVSGTKATAVIVLNGAVPGAGETVNLRTEDPEHVKLPSTVLIPGGVSRYTLNFETKSVEFSERVPIVVSVHGASSSVLLNLQPHRQLFAKSFFFRVNQDEDLIISSPGLLDGAFDPNPSADEDQARIIPMIENIPEHGAVTLDERGGFRYTPAVGFVGSDSFTFIARKGDSMSDPQIVQVWVEPKIAGIKIDGAKDLAAGTYVAKLDLTGVPRQEGLRVSLDCDQSGLLDLPSAVLIPKGESSASFMVTVHPVPASTTVFVKASLNGAEKDLMLVLRPSAAP